jgi:DNA-binding SARP family transcriptional activator
MAEETFEPSFDEQAEQADPAAEVLAWLRGEFDDVNASIHALSDRVARQEAAAAQVASSQAAEVNVSLAELEGSAARLRNEAAALAGTGTAIEKALPALVADAVAPVLAAGMQGAVHELRAAVSELGAALAEALPGAVADAVVPAVAAATPAPAAADDAPAVLARVVDDAVRQAVERWLTTLGPPPAPPAPPPRAAVTEAPATAAPAEAAPQPDPDPPSMAVPEAQAPEAHAPEAALVDRPAPPVAAPGVAPVAAASADNGVAAGAADGDKPDTATAACVLPGVTVGPTLALGVSSALRRARLRRRRRRPAGAPAAGHFRDDPFVGELSRSLERFALARRGLAWSPNGDGGPGTPVVAAERNGAEVPVDLSAGPLAVVGPDAADAGRALLTTILATAEPDTATVVAVGDVLPPGPSFPGLERLESLETALERLETEIGRRQGGSVADGSPRDGGPTGPHPLLVLATPPPGGLGERLSALARRGAAVGVTVLVVGDTLDGAASVRLEAGALVDAGSGPHVVGDLAGARAYGLSPEATAELLDVLVAARTDDGPITVGSCHDEPFPVLVTADPAPIHVQVLGQYRIEIDGTHIRSGLRAKARELLAFYLLHPEGTTLDAATEALWPEADPGRGSEWFWTALGNLRSLLRSATGNKTLKIIERDGDLYRIEPVFDVDLWRFQAALPPQGASTGDPEWAAALQSAADLCRGELLAGVDWAWVEVPREDLRRRGIDVLVSLAATRLVGGDVRAALDALSRAVDIDPLSEQLYRRIMRLHAKQSRPEDVTVTFGRLKSRLAELDLEPTPESERLLVELTK